MATSAPAAPPAVTILEAAQRLGVNPATVRRRIKRGELRSRQQPNASGFVWLVELDEPPAQAPAQPSTPQASATKDPGDHDAQAAVTLLTAHNADLRATVDALRNQLDRAETELDARRREVRELHTLLAASSRLALPVPVDVSTQASTQPAQPSTPPDTQGGTQAGTQGPPWWRRALAWWTAGSAGSAGSA